MHTQWLIVDPEDPAPETMAIAANVIRAGGIVAFPTETVYGLGANALDASAVARIYEAKGRPSRNPIIVHVLDTAQARELASEWPCDAERLAQAFWPGPLSLVVPRRPIVPDIVTAGGPTVAIRCPRHPLARALIAAAGVPLAAPSANVSNRVSPTIAEHVRRTLDGRIDLILDGGPARGGLESTVVDVSRQPARVLRLGLISPEELTATLGESVHVRNPPSPISTDDVALSSPGMLTRHYAPRVPLECLKNDRQRVNELLKQGRRVGWLRFGESNDDYSPTSRLMMIVLSSDPAHYASRLFAALYEFEDAEVDCIVVQRPPDGLPWLAIQDRLSRASAPPQLP